MAMEGFAALPGGGTDGNNLAGLLLDHMRNREMDDRVDALEVDAHHVVPLLFGHLFDGEIFQVPDARVGDENVQPPESGDGVIDKLLIFGMLADVGFERFHTSAMLAGFLLDLERGVLGFDVAENNVGAGFRDDFTDSRPNAP